MQYAKISINSWRLNQSSLVWVISSSREEHDENQLKMYLPSG